MSSPACAAMYMVWKIANKLTGHLFAVLLPSPKFAKDSKGAATVTLLFSSTLCPCLESNESRMCGGSCLNTYICAIRHHHFRSINNISKQIRYTLVFECCGQQALGYSQSRVTILLTRGAPGVCDTERPGSPQPGRQLTAGQGMGRAEAVERSAQAVGAAPGGERQPHHRHYLAFGTQGDLPSACPCLTAHVQW